MTKDEIMGMSEDELNVAVAEKVMGRIVKEVSRTCQGNAVLSIDYKYYMNGDSIKHEDWQPSANIAAAFEVVDKLLENVGIDFRLENSPFREWIAQFTDDGRIIADVQCKTAPEAICKAALLSLLEG